MTSLAYGETVTRLRPSTSTDRYGNAVEDWSTPAELVVDNCALAPQIAGELQPDGRTAVPGDWTLYVPDRHVDITAHDRIDTPYGIFDVDGDPALWRSPFTARRGMTVRLHRLEG